MLVKYAEFVITHTKENRRRIKTKTEAKAKVVASVWGAEFIQFLAPLLCTKMI